MDAALGGKGPAGDPFEMPSEPFEMMVERGKVREFARAVGAFDPAYLEAADPVAPPTFLVTQEFWTGREHRPLDWAGLNPDRLLHGQQEFTFHGPPPRAGARLTGVSRIDKIHSKQGERGGAMTFLELVTEYRDERGRLVAEARATLIETSAPPGGAG